MPELLDRLVDPLRYPQFLPGLLTGTVALVAAGAWARLASSATAGVALVAAVVAALSWLGTATSELAVGLAMLLAAGWLLQAGSPDRRERRVGRSLLSAVLGGGLAVLGVLVLAGVAEASLSTRGMVMVGGLVVTWALLAFDQRSPHAGWGPLLVLLTVGGIYATVPETPQARVLLAAALPVGLLGLPWRPVRLGPTGALLVGGLLTWVVAVGGTPRPGSVVGALLCSGLLLADPIARLLAGATRLERVPATFWGWTLVVGIQLPIVLFAARVAGLRSSLIEAAVLGLPLLAIGIAVLAIGSGGKRERP